MGDREARNLAAVHDLFQAWDRGEVGYNRFLADDCLYETAGFPVLRGKAAILAFLFGGGLQEVGERYGNPRLVDIRRLRAEVIHEVAQGNVVFMERIDHHYTADGEEVLAPRIASVMEFDAQGHCTGWRDYHDPAFFVPEPTLSWSSGQRTALAP